MNRFGAENEVQVVELINGSAGSRFVIACEHAWPHIPCRYNNLGLDEQAQLSHAAWDPGALGVARFLSDELVAPLVASRISRLVIDCNRELDAHDIVPAKSEIYDVPGNVGLTSAERAHRVTAYHQPFHAALTSGLAHGRDEPVLVTVHSFAPIYNGIARSVEIGIVHDQDDRLANGILHNAQRYTSLVVERNAPYGPEDGVTYTLRRHGVAHNIANVMIEIRNDLIATPKDQLAIARMLANLLQAAYSTAPGPVHPERSSQ